MTSIGSPSPFFLAGKKAYEVERSLRFNDNDSAYLSRTPSSVGNRKKWTWSAWIKIGNLGRKMLFGTPDGNDPITNIEITTSNGLAFYNYDSGYTWDVRPSRVFRDVGAWFHLVLVADTGNSTSGDRIQIYFNGVRETSFGTETYPSQDYEGGMNKTIEHRIGSQGNRSGQYFDGYMAEINFVDGQAYDASYFGKTDPVTGQWNPKKYVGSYGTNGFYLNFSDNSGTTATTLGKDSSGNGNNFTPNNLSVYDSMPDTPTNNFAVMNPLTNYSGLSQGNLRFNAYNDSGGNRSTQATIAIPKSGKWYLEARYQEDYLHSLYMGLSQIQMNTGYLTHPTVYYDSAYGTIAATGESNVSGGSWYNIGSGNSVILSMAIDVDNNSVKYYKNNSLQGTIALPTLTSSQEYFFTWANSSGGSNSGLNNTFNFGADSTFQGQETSGGNTDANGIGDFKYAPPSGHLALCSANLPDPTILLPNKHFDTLLYTGNDGSQSITGLNFQPDWAWIKERANSYHHSLTDSVRGVLKSLSTSRVDITEYSESSGLNEFLSNGLSFNGRGYFFVNRAADGVGQTYVAWNWNAGDTDGKTYTVKVHDFSGNNRYIFDDFQTQAVTLDLAEGGTYIFNMDDASNASHPFSIGTAANGTVYTSGITYFLDGVSKTYSQYTSGFAAATTRRLHITVPASAPVLYYWCSVHSGMGGQINTNSTLGSSNFDGTTQSLVKANTTAGFSIVTYTGTGSLTTLGHGLGVAPQVVITKPRSATGDWGFLHTVGDPTAENRLHLNDNGGYSSYQGYKLWGDTVPTSSVFTVREDGSTNASGVTYVAYVLSEVVGYSKFGKYTGNGSSDGTFVFTGFRPAWVMTKRTDSSDHWNISDAKRGNFNEIDEALYANNAQAEGWNGSLDKIDYLSNGFKIRANNSQTNASGGTYIYLAFAESSFKNARAR